MFPQFDKSAGSGLADYALIKEFTNECPELAGRAQKEQGETQYN
jgi:hypothetical protein